MMIGYLNTHTRFVVLVLYVPVRLFSLCNSRFVRCTTTVVANYFTDKTLVILILHFLFSVISSPVPKRLPEVVCKAWNITI